jgi:hypothetical protein
MNRVLSLLLLTAAALTLGSTAALAQFGRGGESQRMIHFGLGGGMSVPVSDAKDALKNGFGGQGWVSLTPKWIPVTLRATFDFQKSNVDSLKFQGVSYGGGTNQILSGLANARFDLMQGALRPYIVLGLGGYNVKTSPSATNVPSSSSTNFGINGGAGLSVQLGQIYLYVEGRVDNVYTNKGLIDTKTVQVIPVTFGLSY